MYMYMKFVRLLDVYTGKFIDLLGTYGLILRWKGSTHFSSSPCKFYVFMSELHSKIG